MKSGFTIIEMLIVILIMAILMGLLVPAITRIICSSKATKTEVILSQVVQACENYRRDYPAYPPSDASLGSCKISCTHLPNDANWNYLGRTTATRQAYLDLGPSAVGQHPNGIINPIDQNYWFKYRSPGIRNPFKFDCYTDGCDASDPMNFEAINNWKK